MDSKFSNYLKPISRDKTDTERKNILKRALNEALVCAGYTATIYQMKSEKFIRCLIVSFARIIVAERTNCKNLSKCKITYNLEKELEEILGQYINIINEHVNDSPIIKNIKSQFETTKSMLDDSEELKEIYNSITDVADDAYNLLPEETRITIRKDFNNAKTEVSNFTNKVSSTALDEGNKFVQEVYVKADEAKSWYCSNIGIGC